jgi:hypothetical protein
MSDNGVRTASALAPRIGHVPLRHPWATLAFVLAIVGALGLGVARVEKDPSIDAFVPLDHPAAIARAEAAELFGLEDPIVVALTAPRGESMFTPERLQALRRIHERVQLVPGVDRSNVISLADESAISGDGRALVVDPILEEGALTSDSARLAWQRVQAMPMLLDLLASRDGNLVTVIIPVEDANHASTQFAAVSAIAAEETPLGTSIHLAGVASMNVRLAEIVDGDTRIFVPLAFLTVFVILFVALRQWAALIGPLLVVAGAAACGIGLMGWLDAKYYLITTMLPVMIMGIAVAD